MKTVPKYVPVLRWKGAEITAVLELTDQTKKSIQPLFEFVPKDFSETALDRTIALRVRDLLEKWGWTESFFIDFSLLPQAKAGAAMPIFDRNAIDLKAILTTGIVPPLEIEILQGFASVKQHGLCIRLSVYDFRQARFQNTLVELVEKLRLDPKQVDIVIDYRVMSADSERIERLIAMLPRPESWRTITVVAGSFPADLSRLEKNNQYLLERNDWLTWREYSLASGIARFGDYTVQHGIFEEHEGKGRNFSASIRYTGPADWVIMRGEGVRNKDGPGYAQWPANAELLISRPEFCGESFSFGDRYIKEMASQTEYTGGPKEWLTAGINHHITYVTNQLSDLENTPSESAATNEAAPDWPAIITGS